MPGALAVAALLACGGGDTKAASVVAGPAAESGADRVPTWRVRHDEPSYQLKAKRHPMTAIVVPVQDDAGRKRYLVELEGAGPEGVPYVLEEKVSSALGIRYFGVEWRGRQRALVSRPPPDKPGANWLIMGFFDAVAEEVDPEAVDARSLLARHQRLAESGELERLARFDRGFWTAVGDAELAEAVAAIEEECGPVQARIDWSDVPDEQLGETSFAKVCVDGVKALADICKRGAQERKAVQDAPPLVCKVDRERREEHQSGAERGSATVGKDALWFTPHWANPRRRSYATLARALGVDREVLPVGRGYLVVPNQRDAAYGSDEVWIGDGKAFVRHPSERDIDGSSNFLWAAGTSARITRISPSRWKIECGGRKQVVEELPPARRDVIIEGASFEDRMRWKRRPYALARDSRGTYYYVDRYRKDLGGRHFRVFIGRRGAMKLSKLTNVVSDSKGSIFSTRRGELRLVIDENGNGSAVWVRGRRRQDLTTVPITTNRKFIYGELGVYLGEELGHLCEL